MEITYKLQSGMFGLTVVVTIATIAGVFLQWDDVSILLDQILGRVNLEESDQLGPDE